jgi:hypothetical protein
VEEENPWRITTGWRKLSRKNVPTNDMLASGTRDPGMIDPE